MNRFMRSERFRRYLCTLSKGPYDSGYYSFDAVERFTIW